MTATESPSPSVSCRREASGRERGHCDVAAVQVAGDAVEVVHPEGADEARRVGCPGRMTARGVGIEHRVIDDQLAASLEDIAERLRPALALEGVLLFDELPGQIAPLPAQLVTHPGELLLLRQMPLPCPEPLVVFHHLVSCHVILPPRALVDSAPG